MRFTPLPELIGREDQQVTSRALRLLSERQFDSVYLSKYWFAASIESWRDQASFETIELVSKSSATVWALIGKKREWRHRIMPVRVLALNQACEPTLDQPWIERNGFFGEHPQDFESHLGQLLERLLQDENWDELRLPGLTGQSARQAIYQAARIGLIARIDLEQPSFNIDLNSIREKHSGDYLRALSANTRQQLRRSRRIAEQTFGPVVLEEAQSAEEALQWFGETGPLHRARWGETDSPSFNSGFDNPEFVAFHRRLIEYGFAERTIQYLKCSAGGVTFAYLYNFVAGDRVHFYLSGVNYGVSHAIRPGMLAHWMAIEKNLSSGRSLYDFLAGDARYKRSLSTGEDRTVWLVLRRPRWRLEIESWARQLKSKISGDPVNSLNRIPHPGQIR
jgi:Acetyltransferase (GNAT) domain